MGTEGMTTPHDRFDRTKTYRNKEGKIVQETERKVHPAGHEWTRRREEDRQAEIRDDTIFGDYVVRVADFINQSNGNPEKELKIKHLRETLPMAIDRLHQRLAELAKTESTKVVNFFLEFLTDDQFIENYKRLIKVLLEQEKISAELKTKIKNNSSPYRSITIPQLQNELAEIVTEIYAEKKSTDKQLVLPDEIFIEMLRIHIKNIVEFLNTQSDELFSDMDTIQNLIMKKVKSREWPVTQEIVEERIKTMRYMLVDDLTSVLPTNVGGIYQSTTHTAKIRASIQGELFTAVLAHEIMHSLSGKDERLITINTEGNETKYECRKINKMGVRSAKATKDGGALSWLDEAITEDLTVELLSSENKSFLEERQLLQLLQDKGVPREIILAAYFENYTVVETGSPTPNSKALFNITNELFYPGFLIDLDNYIKKHDREVAEEAKIAKDIEYDNDDKSIKENGVAKALREWQENGDHFLEMIKDNRRKPKQSNQIGKQPIAVNAHNF